MGRERVFRVGAVAAMLAVVASVGASPASERLSDRDRRDARGELDLADVRFEQRVREARLSIRTHGPLPAIGSLDGHPKRIDAVRPHLCLALSAPEFSRRLLCLGGQVRRGTVNVGVSRLYANGFAKSRGRFTARVERPSRRTLTLRFSLRHADLDRPGTVRWRAVSSGEGKGCLAPAAATPPEGSAAPRQGFEPSGRAGEAGADRQTNRCFDRLPDKGARSMRVRPLERVGCESGHDLVYTNGSRRRKRVALTFDDGPTSYTKQILEILKRKGAKATFFHTGESVINNPGLPRKIVEQGSEVANHSRSHEQYAGAASMRATNRLIEKATNFRPCTYRPPYGLMNGAIANAAKRQGMTVALWDVDTDDWRRPGSSAIASRALQAGPGSIVLMHDGGGPREQTVAAVPRIIDGLRARGFRLVTVNKLMGGSFKVGEVGHRGTR